MNNQKNIVKVVAAIAVIIILGSAYYFFNISSRDKTVVTDTIETVTNKDLNFSFTFESGATALSSMETTPEQFGDPFLKKMYMLMETKELEIFDKAKESGEEREAPPAISVLVFERGPVNEELASSSEDLSAIERITQWAKDNSQFTSINLATNNIEEVEIDGVKAIHYQADGLYRQDVYVLRYGKNMYLFVGQSLAEGDYMSKAFQKVIASVLFD